MKFRLLLCILIISTVSILAQAQKTPAGLSGKIIDDNSGEPVEYANIVVFSAADKAQVTGAVTNSHGQFEISDIKPGSYYIDVTFMGYEKKHIDDLKVKRGSPTDLGEIKLKQKGVTMENVVVEGERVPYTYKIDKKVISVDQMSTTTSGSAADVLSNVPSVTTDIDGNVSLRGSSSFTVLIDGRPTIMDAQDALQQIPASTIDDIEIITNPSAKYDPEGVSGIINVVLKKSKTTGISGLTNISGGPNDKYGADVLVEFKNSDFTAQIGADYSKRGHTGDMIEDRISTYQSTISTINSTGDSKRFRENYGVKGNISFNLSSSDVLGFGGRLGHRGMGSNSTLHYTEFTNINTTPVYQLNLSDEDRSGITYSLSTNFQHKFGLKGHEITADASFDYDDNDETSINELVDGNLISEGKKTTESGPSKEFSLAVDYTLPIGAEGRFEAGLRGETENSDENSGMFTYNPVSSQYEFQDKYSYDVNSTKTEYSLYSTYSNTLGALGYQAGLRGEYTYRDIELEAKNQKFNIDRWDFFPTLHLSYKFGTDFQIMSSYTRRIQRPRSWSLEPFETWMDANTVRRGNPGLEPELIDSYELGFQTLINKASLTVEGYYRVTNNKTEGVKSAYSENVTLQTFENVGTDYSLGAETMLSFEALKFWNVDLMGSLYDYRVEGAMSGKSFSKNSFNWRGRINNLFKITETLQLQLSTEYNSPSVTSQSKTKEYFSTDLALKKDLFEKKLSLTLQVRDLFKTGKMESTTETADIYSYQKFTREAPMVMLNVRYSINNFKQQKSKQSGESDYGDEGY